MRRELGILQLMLERDGFVSVSELSSVFKVSERSVYNDLERIESALRGSAVRIVRSRSKGVRLDTGNITSAEARRVLAGTFRSLHYYSDDERFDIIVQRLFLSEEGTTIRELSEETLSSRTTTQRDLARAEEWLRGHRVSLVRMPRVGIRLECDEQSWRLAVLSFIVSHTDETYLQQLYLSFDDAESYAFSPFGLELVDRVVASADAFAVRAFISDYEDAYDLKFTDDGRLSIFLYICIACMRVGEGCHLADCVSKPGVAEVPAFAEWAPSCRVLANRAMRRSSSSLNKGLTRTTGTSRSTPIETVATTRSTELRSVSERSLTEQTPSTTMSGNL